MLLWLVQVGGKIFFVKMEDDKGHKKLVHRSMEVKTVDLKSVKGI
jgi:hypothetical protein